jgi:shikimate kinase
MKPTIIYVSGAPGSGKTTLAKILSDQLYIPRVSSDLLKGGLRFADSDRDVAASIQSIFVPILVDHVRKGISIVVDHVLQNDIAKSTIIDALTEYANVIYIHVQTSDPIKRYVDRTNDSTIPDIMNRRELLLGRADHHTDNLGQTAGVIQLGVPTIIVNTDEGYEPVLDQIIAFIMDAQTQQSRPS